MSKRRASEELEIAFRQVLNQFLYNMPRGESTLLTTQVRRPSPAGRHNYQRAIAEANGFLEVFYKKMHICTVTRKPNTISLIKRTPEKAPKGYFASKVLERVLFYDYPDVRLQ